MNDKKIILVTEDEVSLRSAISIKLIKEGFNVLEAKDGIEGLEISLKEHPDLIVLDLAMPKLDGMSMLRLLRKDDWGKNVPVIILTNLPSEDEDRNKDITELEPTYYFTKVKMNLEQVAQKIKERLNLL